MAIAKSDFGDPNIGDKTKKRMEEHGYHGDGVVADEIVLGPLQECTLRPNLEFSAIRGIEKSLPSSNRPYIETTNSYPFDEEAMMICDDCGGWFDVREGCGCHARR